MGGTHRAGWRRSCSAASCSASGVAMLLTADLGSDGFSTLVNGVAIATGMSFLLANLLVSLCFLAVAALRKVFPAWAR